MIIARMRARLRTARPYIPPTMLVEVSLLMVEEILRHAEGIESLVTDRHALITLLKRKLADIEM